MFTGNQPKALSFFLEPNSRGSEVYVQCIRGTLNKNRFFGLGVRHDITSFLLTGLATKPLMAFSSCQPVMLSIAYYPYAAYACVAAD